MMRFQTVVASVLAPLFVVPVFLGQEHLASLEQALAGTLRALEVLKGLEQRLEQDPAAAMGLLLAATEVPGADELERDQRLEELRGEVGLLQMELDALQSPVLGPDGAVQSALGANLPLRGARGAETTITTGLDDSLRALLAGRPPARAARANPAQANPAPGTAAAESGGGDSYSADPLRHGIACYRAGRFAEAVERLAPLDVAGAHYWRARALERLERLDEAVLALERALASAADGELRHAETDLDFLRWKRDFVKGLPTARAPGGKEPR